MTMTISEVLDQKLGVDSSTKFLRKANALMAGWDASEGSIEKSKHAVKLMDLFADYGLSKEEQIQYKQEIAEVMNENLKLWEMTR